MPRQRMQPGEWGKITVREAEPGKFTATTYIRDEDGKRREVERSGRSEEDARRNLLRELRSRSAPVTAAALVTDKTTLSELFAIWLATKKIKRQSATQYRRGWERNAEKQIGALRIREFPTSRGEAHLKIVSARSATSGKQLRTILVGMFALAVRYDVIKVNPIRETRLFRCTRQTHARRHPPSSSRSARQSENSATARGGTVRNRAVYCPPSSTFSGRQGAGRMNCWPCGAMRSICWPIRRP
ncbi:hypothetical protein [Nocardia brevicatena]|uniref:hypothetical protein n=1 Tax=Nocardia brevicatena TaxID=37327 RepID=UPI00278C3201|nr:hypothetical protein [Nocardia brevicatena]